MKLGVDFDNTLVNYDGLFHRAGLEMGWIPKTVGTSKQAVKNYLIENDSEAKWTELQGIVYGETIAYATPYPEAFETLRKLKTKGVQLFLVSHKTRYPIIGEKRDFHAAASAWLSRYASEALFNGLYFCPEKDEKIQKIVDLCLDAYVDDLPSVLLHQNFPVTTQKVLFDSGETQHPNLTRIEHWTELLACLPQM